MNIQKQQGKILLELPEPEILEKRPIRNKDIPSESGIYFIFDEVGNLIYVGQSMNLSQRTATQRTAIPNASQLAYILINSPEEINIIEQIYINFYQPWYNLNPPWITIWSPKIKKSVDLDYLKICQENLKKTLEENKDRSLI